MSNAPGGLSDAEFKSWYVEAGDWVWGTVQGSFNEKMSISQIVVDAVIGMIPLLGDVTAVRDLLAVSMGMAESEEKRNSVLEWVTIVILLLALIPVLGGVIKGVGKLTLRAVRQAAKASPQAALRILAQTAEEIIEFMNRLGIGNAKKWFLDLNIMQHQEAVLKHFSDFTSGVILAIDKVLKKMSWFLPANLIARLKQISAGMKSLGEKGKEMIPLAVKEFHGYLVWMQTYIRTGGAPQLALQVAGTGAAHATANSTHAAANTAQSTSHAAQQGSSHAASAGKSDSMNMVMPEIKPPKGEQLPKPGQVKNEPAVAGKNNKTPTNEARLDEKATNRRINPKTGGAAQNTAIDGAKPGNNGCYSDFYSPEPGYPDLTKRVDEKTKHLTEIEAFSGKMTNRALRSDEKIYRVFGPEGTTHKIKVDESKAGGKWWGVGEPPKDAKTWREGDAVRDEWNRDEFLVVGTPPAKPPKQPAKGVFGDVSEQFSESIPGQYLPGGRPQAVLELPQSTIDELTQLGRATIGDSLPRGYTCPTTGIKFDIMPTHWDDANGIHGYISQLGQPGSRLGTASLGRHTVAPQTRQEAYVP